MSERQRTTSEQKTAVTQAEYETLASFRDGVEHFERLFAVGPAAVAHDLHPEYLSTKYFAIAV